MSNLIRCDPASEIVTQREAMDRLIDEAYTHPFCQTDGWHGSNVPAIDMYQTDNDVVVKAALPGIKADDVQINVTGDILTIKGEMKEKSETKEKNYHIREQRWGAFERSVMLPTSVISDKAKAEFEDGVLTITLPKAEEVKPKLITVKSK